MRVVILGDLGTSDAYHAGDEAMAVAAVAELRKRGEVEVIALAVDPAAVTARHGWSAVHTIGFSGTTTDAERDARLAAVLAAAGGDLNALEWGDPGWEVIHAVGQADGVLITGGGNVNSSWPEHVYERAALAEVARLLERPLVVTGQTIGPHLTQRHGELASTIVTSAVLAGVREEASFEVCQRLGVRPESLCLVVDDAAFVEEDAAGVWSPPAEPYVAATFAAHSGLFARETYVALLADLVKYAHRVTGAPVVLVPHQAPLDGQSGGDVELHDAVAAAADGAAISLPMQPGVEAAAARGAVLVLSSRYHPTVYALYSGVPVVALSTDAYTHTKLAGVMSLAGMGAYALSAPSLLVGHAHNAIDDLWARRSEVTKRLSATSLEHRRHSASWWDAVSESLVGKDVPAPAPTVPADAVQAGEWSSEAAATAAWVAHVDNQIVTLQLALVEEGDARATAEAEVVALEIEVAHLRSHLDAAADDISTMQESVRAANELTERYLEKIVIASRDAPTVASLSAELSALRATRTFRYTAPLRAVWGKLHRRLSTRGGPAA